MTRAKILAKLTTPRIENVLPRNRLFKLLDNARKTHNVIWISSPAGSGKTSLITSYLQHVNLSPLWYQIDTCDTDLSSFFYYLGQGLKAVTGTRKKMPALTPEYQLGIRAFTRNYFRELFARLKNSQVLVIDNFQDAGDSALVNEMLADGLKEMPSGSLVIIISRTTPPKYFSRLRSNAQLIEIGWSHLKFTVEEEHAVTQLLFPDQNINLLKIEKLNQYTGGWITGLILFIKQDIDPGQTNIDWSEADQNYIFQYFASEVLHHTDEITRIFLLKSALFPKMNASITQKLTGINSAKKILSNLVRQHLFTVRHGFLKTSYDYHPLFREFLLCQAIEQFTEDEFRELQARAGHLLAEVNDVDNAVILLQQGQNWPVLCELIQTHAKILLEQGRHKQLEQWIQSIPQSFKIDNAWLYYWYGECQLQFDPIQARTPLITAYSLFLTLNDSEGAYAAWSNIAMSYFFAQDEYGSFLKWFDELSSLQKRWPKFPSMEIKARIIQSVLTNLSFSCPHHTEMPKWISMAESLFKYFPIKPLRVVIGTALTMAHYFSSGDFHKMLSFARTIEPLTKDNSLPPVLQIMANFCLSGVSWSLPPSSLSDASIYVNRALNISKNTGVKTLDCLILTNGIYASLVSRDIHKADIYLEKLSAFISDKNRLDLAHYYKLMGAVEIEKNNYEMAICYLEDAQTLTHLCKAPLPELTIICVQILAYIKNKNIQLAKKSYTRGKAIAKQVNNITAHTMFNSISAYYAIHIDDEQKTINCLQQTFASINKYNNTSFIANTYPIIQDLCIQALKYNIEIDSVRRIIRLYEVLPDENDATTEAWPYPVKIYTLGRFRLLINDEAIEFSGKAQKKPLELLKALIALGGRDVRDDQITEILWPDVEGDAAYSSLKTTVNRLRKLLNTKEAITFSDSKLGLYLKYCWVDCWAFERSLGQAGNDIAQLKKTLTFYQGNFLPGETEYHWLIPIRERLRRKFIKAISMLSEHYEQQQQWISAIDMYQKGLHIDSLAEVFYQGLMRCYHAIGQQAEIIKTYQQCDEFLQSKLHIKPSIKTENLLTELQEQ